MMRWDGINGMGRRFSPLGDSRPHAIECTHGQFGCRTMTIAFDATCDDCWGLWDAPEDCSEGPSYRATARRERAKG